MDGMSIRPSTCRLSARLLAAVFTATAAGVARAGMDATHRREAA